MKRSAFKPSAKPMSRGAPMARGKPMKVRRKARPKVDGVDYIAMCRDQPCFILLGMVRFHDHATVVACHSNQSQHGKGMGIKANDKFTVPGCHLCHQEIDQGKTLSREERRAAWDAAYARWSQVREKLTTGE